MSLQPQTYNLNPKDLHMEFNSSYFAILSLRGKEYAIPSVVGAFSVKDLRGFCNKGIFFNLRKVDAGTNK